MEEKVLKDTKKEVKSEREPKEKNEKEIEPIKDGKVSEVLTFSDNKKDQIVVETVGSFRNLFNYLNTPLEKKRFLEDGIYELIPINYRIEDNRELELIKSQTLKIVMDKETKEGKEITLDDLIEFFTRNPDLFNDILTTILGNSMGRVKGLYLMRKN